MCLECEEGVRCVIKNINLEACMKILKVPYIKQINSNSCGAAVLEMVYKYYGIENVSQEELMDRYKELEPHGSGNYRMATDTLVADAKEKGFKSECLRANYKSAKDCFSLLRENIEIKKIPVIVCQKFTDEEPLIGHFRVVIGMDENSIYLHDPHLETGGERLKWSLDKFINFWQPTGDNVTGGIFCLISKKDE